MIIQGFRERWWPPFLSAAFQGPSDTAHPSERGPRHLNHLPSDQHHPSRLDDSVLRTDVSVNLGAVFQLLRPSHADLDPEIGEQLPALWTLEDRWTCLGRIRRQHLRICMGLVLRLLPVSSHGHACHSGQHELGRSYSRSRHLHWAEYMVLGW